MKAFEKWRDKNAMSGRSHKADARVWRAALEWVKEHHVELGIEDWTIIEKELEN